MVAINGFIIGNGESRKGFKLNSLKNHGKIYGCNALYRDFTPDTLVSVDRRMIEEIQSKKYKGEFIFYNRKKDRLTNHEKPIFSFPYRGWATGPTATWLLCHRMYHHVHKIYLLGFDFGSDTKLVNNVYKSTSCYRLATGNSPNAKNWVHQFRQIFVEFPDKMFYQVQRKSGDFLPREFIKYDNFNQITYKQFKTKITG